MTELSKKRRCTVGEAAHEIGCGVVQVYRLINEGKLRARVISLSGKIVPQGIRVDVDSICEFLDKRRVKPGDLEKLAK